MTTQQVPRAKCTPTDLHLGELTYLQGGRYICKCGRRYMKAGGGQLFAVVQRQMPGGGTMDVPDPEVYHAGPTSI